MNLNKIVVLGSILATSLLLPIHLDDWDALNSSSPKHPGIQYLKNLNEQRANRLKESQELDKQLNLENGEEMIVKVSNDTGFEKERVNRRMMGRYNRRFRNRGKQRAQNLEDYGTDDEYYVTGVDFDNNEILDFDENSNFSKISTNKNHAARSISSYGFLFPSKESSMSLLLALSPLLFWQILALIGGSIGIISYLKYEKAKREGRRARSPPVPSEFSNSILPDFVQTRRRNQQQESQNQEDSPRNHDLTDLIVNEDGNANLVQTQNRRNGRNRRTHTREKFRI